MKYFGLLLSVLVLFGCSQQSETDVAAQVAQGPQATLVVTSTAISGPWIESMTLSAETAPVAVVDVAAELGGRVIRWHPREGETVRTGETLIELDTVQAELEIERLSASLQAAQATATQAGRDLERGHALAATQDLATADLESLILAEATASARHRETTAALASARDRLDRLSVKAPITGSVSSRMVEIGSWVNPGQALYRLVDRRRLELDLSVSANQRSRLTLDLELEFEASALPAQIFLATIISLGEEADSATGTYPVTARIDKPRTDTSELLPGMSGRATLVLARREALSVPSGAVMERGDAILVAIAEGDSAVLREVVVGSNEGGRVEIISGLQGGEAVVIRGQHSLAEGEAIRIRE